MTPGLEHLILTGASATQIEARALEDGMRSLREAALARVESGETTLHEVRRVLGDSIENSGDAHSTEGANATASAPTAGTEANGTPAGPARILVVDDDPVTTAVARALLERDQYEVDAAGGGEEALEKLTSGDPYALVVLDLRMPESDGRHVLREIRDRAATARTPVIVLTQEDTAESEAELLLGGADDYLCKPIDAVRFGARVHAVLRRARS